MPRAPAVYPTEAGTPHLVPSLEGLANNTRAYGASVVAWVILADMDDFSGQATTQSSRQELQEDPSDVAAAARLAHQAAQQGLEETRKRLGRRLKELREAAGLPQCQLGEKLHTSRSNICKAERRGCMHAVLWKFADAVLSANGELTELHALAEKAAKDAKRAASEASRAEASLEKDRVLRRPPASVVTTVIKCPKCGSPLTAEIGIRACYF